MKRGPGSRGWQRAQLSIRVSEARRTDRFVIKQGLPFGAEPGRQAFHPAGRAINGRAQRHRAGGDIVPRASEDADPPKDVGAQPVNQRELQERSFECHLPSPILSPSATASRSALRMLNNGAGPPECGCDSNERVRPRDAMALRSWLTGAIARMRELNESGNRRSTRIGIHY